MSFTASFFLFFFSTVAFLSIAAPFAHAASENKTVIATVSSVSLCTNQEAIYKIALLSSTTPLVIYRNKGTAPLPKPGEQIFGLLGTTTSCGAASGRTLSFFSLVPAQRPATTSLNQASQGGGSNPNPQNSPISDLLQSVLQSLASVSRIGSLPNALTTPFGGRLTTALPCTCGIPGSFALTLSPPSAGTYLFDPAQLKKAYPYYAIVKPGAYELGTYEPGNPLCKVIVPPSACVPVPITRGTIMEVGTSL